MLGMTLDEFLRQKFRVIDPAALPKYPYKPQRLKIIGMSSLLSLTLGFSIIFLRENARASFHKPEDVQESIDDPVLVDYPP
jgi:uncharacterized protein involved in exopolysaccharide biosynthesis